MECVSAAERLHIDIPAAFGVADVQQMHAALLAHLPPLSGRGKRDTHAAGQQSALSAALSHSIAACMAILLSENMLETC